MTSTLETVKALAPELRARAHEIEGARDVPHDLIDQLRAAGVFSRFVPRAYGGQELSPLEAITTVEELARADASVAWISAVGSEAPAFFAYLPPETYDKIYTNGPDVIFAGSIVPKGTAERVDGGFRFTGQWAFASGCTNADYLCIQSFVVPRAAGAPPSTVFGIVPASDLEILDTWFVHGLKGTASRDIVAKGHFVPDEWTGTFTQALLAYFGIEFAATALGIAQGALDDIVAIATVKEPMGGIPGRLSRDPVLHHMIGDLVTDLHMARTLLHDVARLDGEAVISSHRELPPSSPYRSSLVPADEGADAATASVRRAKLARVGSVSASVVERCYTASGTTGLFDSSPLGRRLRDIYAVTQHYLLSSRAAFWPAGAAVLGEGF
jgi:alkylation response protein AidB-like acyl-CoA dehydrogenase